jgi:hypothetical protein
MTNKPVDITKVKNLIKGGSSYAYFFNTITSPDWLMPLINEGFFANPPAAEKDGQWVSFPVWPEINYLLKVASVSPDEATIALDKISDTDNQYVLDMFVKVLLEIGTKRAVRFTDRVVAFLAIPFQFRIHEGSTKLVCLLAKEGYTNEAIKITEALLEVMPDPRAENAGTDEYQKYLIEPQIKYRDYDYQEIIEKVTPDLVAADPVAAIKLFSKLLNNAIIYKSVRYEHDSSSDGQDYSNIWRPAIASQKRDHGNQPFDGLVSALRDSLIGLLGTNASDKEKMTVLKNIVDLKFLIFSRIVEHVLQELKDQAPYKELYDEIHKNFDEFLTEKAFVVESGEVVPEPGITIEELNQLDDTGLIQKLISHKPPDRLFGRDAVDDLISAMIKNDPKRFIKIAPEFLAASHQLANGFIYSLNDIVVNLDQQIVDTLLADLSNWLKTTKGTDDDTYYSWAKSALARLVDKLSDQKGKNSEYGSVASAESLLDIILRLARDSDPSPEREERKDSDNWDPVSIAINSTRGEALHALAGFVGWVHRNKADQKYLQQAYGELDWHLNTKNDPSFAIRSVFGQYLPLLGYVNTPWVKDNIGSIFSDDTYGDAAWDAYVSFTQPYKDLLPLTEPFIKKRLSNLRVYPEGKNRRADMGQSQFVHHLMIYYWNGYLDLADGGVIKTFFETADVKYRTEALHFIGFALKEDKSETRDEVLDRLKILWDYRLTDLASSNKENQKELEEFGIWFASNAFADDWAIGNLQKVLVITQNANPDFMVLEKLCTMVEKYPLQAIICLREMIAGARERWSISSWEEHASTIIRTSFESGNPEVGRIAKAQVDILISKGHHNFRNLVKKIK